MPRIKTGSIVKLTDCYAGQCATLRAYTGRVLSILKSNRARIYWIGTNYISYQPFRNLKVIK